MTSEEFKKTGNRVGAMKRKLGVKRDEKIQPGTLISKLNAKKRIAIMGLV